MEEEQTSQQSHVIKWGLIIGIINIIVVLLVYMVDVTMMVGFSFLGIFLVLNIALIIYAGIEWRKANGGFLSFKSAFLTTFFTFVVAGLLGTAFNLLLYNVIDTGLSETLTDASIEQAESMMERFGMPEDQMDEALEKARADATDRFSIGGQLMGFVYGLIFYAVISLIVGAIIKRKNPEEEI
ncbi:MAG: DUF4199 domain-containing protein [Aurantibacter sp.]